MRNYSEFRVQFPALRINSCVQRRTASADFESFCIFLVFSRISWQQFLTVSALIPRHRRVRVQQPRVVLIISVSASTTQCYTLGTASTRFENFSVDTDAQMCTRPTASSCLENFCVGINISMLHAVDSITNTQSVCI